MIRKGETDSDQDQRCTLIQLLPIGAAVIIGEKIRGKITALTLYDGGRVVYCVSHWDRSERKETWVEQFEISTDASPISVVVGFRSLCVTEE